MEQSVQYPRQFWPMLAVTFALVGGACSSATAGAVWTVATDWVPGTGSRVRLIGAELQDGGGGRRLVAGIEIVLEEGWKTYWRSPGDSGGIPPAFDWDQSKNIAKAELLYPAPKRFADTEGVSAGYKKHVVFPIEVTPDGQGPMELVIGVFYGICREICIPVEAEISLTLAPGQLSEPSIADALEKALAAVPRQIGDDVLPSVENVALAKVGDADELIIDARFDAATLEADVFAEAEDGSYVPIPEKVTAASGGLMRFRARLKPNEAEALRGKRLTLTLVSDKGHAEVVRTAN
jgi:DsbC/DsbD-like thiol-disulfide interchange protein